MIWSGQIRTVSYANHYLLCSRNFRVEEIAYYEPWHPLWFKLATYNIPKWPVLLVALSEIKLEASAKVCPYDEARALLPYARITG